MFGERTLSEGLTWRIVTDDRCRWNPATGQPSSCRVGRPMPGGFLFGNWPGVAGNGGRHLLVSCADAGDAGRGRRSGAAWRGPGGEPLVRMSLCTEWPARLLRVWARDTGGEFDPGSGSTLAACLMHASRTGSSSDGLRGGRVRNTWASCPGVGGSRRKRRVIPHVLGRQWDGRGKGLRTRPRRRLRPIS